jgi:hypothetical protein
MTTLPNPFTDSTLEPAMAVESAAAPDLTDPPVAAAEDFRFILNEAAFLEAIEPAPAFLSEPQPEYLAAIDLIPVLTVLAGY